MTLVVQMDYLSLLPFDILSILCQNLVFNEILLICAVSRYFYHFIPTTVNEFAPSFKMPLESTQSLLERTTNLTYLQLRRSENVSGACPKLPISLKNLDIQYNRLLTSSSITHLTNLTKLNITENNMICDNALISLTQLTILDMSYNRMDSYGAHRTDNGVSRLINLKVLVAKRDQVLTGESIKLLTNLTHLDLSDTNKVMDDALKPLVNLRVLILSQKSAITGLCISCLTGLTSLDISHNQTFDYRCLYLLTNLTCLDASRFLNTGRFLHDDVLSYLTNLKSLDISSQLGITGKSISKLTNLTVLGIADIGLISFDTFKPLTNLCILYLSSKAIYDEDIHNLTSREYNKFQLLSDEYSFGDSVEDDDDIGMIIDT